MNPTQIARLAAYLVLVAVGAVLIVIGAVRSDMALIGLGAPMVGYVLPAANVKPKPAARHAAPTGD